LLVDLAVALEDLGFDAREPELTRVARWTAHGLTAYVAAYVALADGDGIRLIIDVDPSWRPPPESRRQTALADRGCGLRSVSSWVRPNVAQTRWSSWRRDWH